MGSVEKPYEVKIYSGRVGIDYPIIEFLDFFSSREEAEEYARLMVSICPRYKAEVYKH